MRLFTAVASVSEAGLGEHRGTGRRVPCPVNISLLGAHWKVRARWDDRRFTKGLHIQTKSQPSLIWPQRSRFEQFQDPVQRFGQRER